MRRMRRERLGKSIIAMIRLVGFPATALAAAYTFTPVDVPFAGVTETDANGVNNSGQIVGFYLDVGGGHAFLDGGGMFSTIVVPDASFTAANGTNNAELIVGHYVDANGLHGFVGKSGNFNPIDVPFDGVTGTFASGIQQRGANSRALF
jgi:hypothetical protein